MSKDYIKPKEFKINLKTWFNNYKTISSEWLTKYSDKKSVLVNFFSLLSRSGARICPTGGHDAPDEGAK